MKMTYTDNETLTSDALAFINEWDEDNANELKKVRPGQWDETFNLQDLDFIYDHIDITR